MWSFAKRILTSFTVCICKFLSSDDDTNSLEWIAIANGFHNSIESVIDVFVFLLCMCILIFLALRNLCWIFLSQSSNGILNTDIFMIERSRKLFKNRSPWVQKFLFIFVIHCTNAKISNKVFWQAQDNCFVGRLYISFTEKGINQMNYASYLLPNYRKSTPPPPIFEFLLRWIQLSLAIKS